MSHSARIGLTLAACLTIASASATELPAAAGGSPVQPMHWRDAPKVVLISLDGARPDLIRRYIRSGVLSDRRGLGLLSRRGIVARENITATPSLTAVSHIAIATGSTAAHNDIPANFYHPVAAPITSGISGFGGPIGGYTINPLGIDATPTAEPMWVRLRNAGKSVVTATWPGGDGVDVRINNVLVQAASPTRVVDYTVPFGAGGGLAATGFTLSTADFSFDQTVADQLAAAGRVSYSQVLTTTAPFETFFCASSTAGTCGTTGSSTLDLPYRVKGAALDTSDDGVVNYDTLAIFSEGQGIPPGPFLLPATGPAYAEAGGPSALFFLEGSGNRIGTAYFVSFMAPDLSAVRLARYSANFIPRNAPVIADVDDINENVGFWAPQPDFRIPQRVSTTFAAFPETELEAMYEDQVRTFVRYQSGVAQRAISSNPGADLIMVYIEEPDGSGHQFTLTDRRQATDPRDPQSIYRNQDRDKIRRYDSYIRFAYQQADRAVQDILALVGPGTNVFVVSDHGMAPFHTTVNARNILRNAGFTDAELAQLSIITSGAAVNVYVNLAGREQGGSVDPATYRTLVRRVADALSNAQDPNPLFNYSLHRKRIFTDVEKRPDRCGSLGFCTNAVIGQDFGDVFAMLAVGYNFDGTQTPPVARLRDPAFDPLKSVFSIPTFYGAHGHNPNIPAMSASFIAAGPDIERGELRSIENIDVAPTIMHLLGVRPGRTVDGEVLHRILD